MHFYYCIEGLSLHLEDGFLISDLKCRPCGKHQIHFEGPEIFSFTEW